MNSSPSSPSSLTANTSNHTRNGSDKSTVRACINPSSHPPVGTVSGVAPGVASVAPAAGTSSSSSLSIPIPNSPTTTTTTNTATTTATNSNMPVVPISANIPLVSKPHHVRKSSHKSINCSSLGSIDDHDTLDKSDRSLTSSLQSVSLSTTSRSAKRRNSISKLAHQQHQHQHQQSSSSSLIFQTSNLIPPNSHSNNANNNNNYQIKNSSNIDRGLSDNHKSNKDVSSSSNFNSNSNSYSNSNNLDSHNDYHYPKRHKIPKPRRPISSCPLLCVFYAEFDNIVGPKICYQSPQKFMDQNIEITSDDIDDLLRSAFHKEQTRGDNSSNNDNNNSSNNINKSKGKGKEKDSNNNFLDDDNHNHDNDDGQNEQESKKTTVDTSQFSTSQNQQQHQHQQENFYSIFDSTSEYIITGHEMLAGQIISLSTHNMHILSFPIIIQNKNYERNSILFSVGFVIRRLFDPTPFRPLLSKLASTFQSMELESAFLSNEQSRHRLQRILDGVLFSLNSPKSECHLLLDDANILHLQYFPPPKIQGPPVPDYVVPVLLRPESQLQSLDWDLTINWIVPHINGIKYVKLIAESSKVDAEMVRASLRVLRHHHAVACVDIFRYDNIYVCTTKAQRMLAGDEELEGLLEEAYHFVSKQPPLATQNGTTSNGSGRGNLSFGSGSNIPTYIASSGGVSHKYSSQPASFGMNHGVFNNSPSGVGIHSPSCSSTNTPTTPTLLHPPLSTSSNTTSFHHPNLVNSKRRDQKSLMKALAILYVSCQKDVTVGGVLINRLFLGKRNNSKGVDDNVPLDTVENDGEQHKMESEKKSSKFRSFSMGSASSIGGGKELDIDWKEVFEVFDHIRFCTFGVIHGLIQRLHEYPMAIDAPVEEEDDTSGSLSVDDDTFQIKEDENRQTRNSKDGVELRMASDFRFSPTLQPQHAPPSIPSLPSLNFLASAASSTGRLKDEMKVTCNFELAKEIALHMNGQKCDDELSCMFQKPISDLKEIVTNHAKKDIISIYQR